MGKKSVEGITRNAAQRDKEIENKANIFSGLDLENSWDLAHVEQTSTGRIDSKLEEVGRLPQPMQVSPCQPLSHLLDGIGDSLGVGVRLASVI